jgi:hypothetical protein
MTRRAILLALVLIAGGAPRRAEAQASVYGVLGIGIPGRPISVRSRALGGGIDLVDPGSAVNPAAIALSSRLTVSGASETTNRKFTAGGVSSDNLRDTRFPFAQISGPIQSSPISFGVSYSIYSERSYDIATVDTLTIRDADVEVSDRLKSDGGIADMRAAVAWTFSQRFQLGVGVHLLAGSTREQLERRFSDPVYVDLVQRGDVDYTGWGLSLGAVATPSSKFRVGAAVRRDSRLNVSDALLPAVEIQLPWTFSAGVTVAPVRLLRLSASAQRRTWSAATDEVPQWLTLFVFDTWEFGSGLEVGGPDVGISAFPLRVGFRYAQLPFSPIDDQPRELGLSAGSGVLFAGNRAFFEFSIERVMRDGGGATERAWQLALGLTLRP